MSKSEPFRFPLGRYFFKTLFFLLLMYFPLPLCAHQGFKIDMIHFPSEVSSLEEFSVELEVVSPRTYRLDSEAFLQSIMKPDDGKVFPFFLWKYNVGESIVDKRNRKQNISLVLIPRQEGEKYFSFSNVRFFSYSNSTDPELWASSDIYKLTVKDPSMSLESSKVLLREMHDLDGVPKLSDIPLDLAKYTSPASLNYDMEKMQRNQKKKTGLIYFLIALGICTLAYVFREGIRSAWACRNRPFKCNPPFFL